MSTEFVPHRGQELVGKVRLAPRTESLIKRRRENWGRYCFIDRSLNGPASFTRVGDVAGKSCKIRVLKERRRGTIQQQRCDDASPPPNLRDVYAILVVLL